MDNEDELRNPLTIFYSSTHEDEWLRDLLEKHLSGLRYQGLIKEWHEQKIVLGNERLSDIEHHLMSSSIVLLLISPDYIASSNYYSDRMQKFLERQQENNVQIIPILLRPVALDGTPLAKFQCLPRNNKPVTMWTNLDEAFLDIAEGIRESIDYLSNLSPSKSAFRFSPEPRYLQIDQRFDDSHTPTLSTEQKRYRSKVLAKVRTLWINGMLEQSLHGQVPIKLHLLEQPTMLENPWQLVLQELHIGAIGSLSVGLRVGLIGELIVGIFVWLIAVLKEKPDPPLPTDRGVLGSLRRTWLSLLNGGLIAGVRTGLIAGLSNEPFSVGKRRTPNQGIWRSARYAAILALIFGSIFGLIGTLAFRQSNVLSFIQSGIISGALLSALVFGGEACMKHVILRLLLWMDRAIPWHYPRFLDYAAERILLYKIGGGFIFIHPEIQKHFATRYETER